MAKKRSKTVGTGKVTPVQIAFIVDRYLSDNNFTNTLVAFRAEAAALFSKIASKQAPRGVLGLEEILEEYIGLKEKRVIVDHEKRRVDDEKRRVETAMQGIQAVMRGYLQPGPVSVAAPSPALAVAAMPSTPSCVPANPVSGSTSGHTTQGTALRNITQPSMLPSKALEIIDLSTQRPKSSSSNKRKATNSAPKVPPDAKKSRTPAPKRSSTVKGKTPPSQVTSIGNTEQDVQKQPTIDPTKQSAIDPTSVDIPAISSSIKGSSVARSLFSEQLKSTSNSPSPKTPPQALPSPAGIAVSPLEDLSLQDNAAAISCEIARTKCSMISSEKIVVSPLKRPGYYSVERSYRVTSSPFKSSPNKQGKREHVRGRLHFDESDALMGSEVPVAAGSSSSVLESPGAFDFDITELDIFTGDFVSELLADFNFNHEEMPSTSQSDDPACFIPGSEDNADNTHCGTNQQLSDSCLSAARRALTQEMSIQGPGSVTSVTTITKSIRISSPVKIRNSS